MLHFILHRLYSSLPGLLPLSPTTSLISITIRCYKFHVGRPQSLLAPPTSRGTKWKEREKRADMAFHSSFQHSQSIRSTFLTTSGTLLMNCCCRDVQGLPSNDVADKKWNKLHAIILHRLDDCLRVNFKYNGSTTYGPL